MLHNIEKLSIYSKKIREFAGIPILVLVSINPFSSFAYNPRRGRERLPNMRVTVGIMPKLIVCTNIYLRMRAGNVNDRRVICCK